MKKSIVLITLSISALLSGCLGVQKTQEITIESGNNELLEVLCAFEEIPRTGDATRIINVIDNDNWNPFTSGETYKVIYEIKTENSETGKQHTLSISVLDTTAPLVQLKTGQAEISVCYSENIKKLKQDVLDQIINAVVITDNSSQFPLTPDLYDIFLTQFDDKAVDRKQEVIFSVKDLAGNITESSIVLKLIRQ